jgi:pyruvate dehydrogenase E2 component (dihydrolipoamide acetyltransferase)
MAAAAAVTQKRAVFEKTVGPQVARRVRLSGIRKVVAERLSYSARTAVPVALTTEVDMTAALAERRKVHGKETVASITAVVVGAAARALESHPELNSTIENDEIVQYADVNVAVAINTSEGLVAPVVRNANQKGIVDLTKEIELLAEKAERKQLEVNEVTGGTFTVTNLGGFGVDSFVPTINPPQCAILAVGRTVDKATVTQGAVHVRPIANLTVVFDHRITDGMPAAKFLQTVRTILEKAKEA